MNHHCLNKAAGGLGWVVGMVVLSQAAAAGPAAEPVASPASAAVTITAGPEWIPLQPELDIVPDSALDFSKLGFHDAPAGKHGRLAARSDGQFVFEDSPQIARRFYGINLCFGAHYLSREEAERLAVRLQRLGYNALRIHHYERDLVQGQPDSTTLNPEQLAQFDLLVTALKNRGIYLSTDLYVSRPVPWKEIGVDKPGMVPMDTFKILVPVQAGAWENWKKFARALLGHVNPHTTVRYADEPALAWLSMINEGNFGNFYRDLATFPEWKAAWNQWLARRYGGRAELAKAWAAELAENEDPGAGSVQLPEKLNADGLRVRDCVAFFAATERDMVGRMRTFLRDELRCRALISNANAWTNFATDQGARDTYDFVDDHFYIDHPQWVDRPWQLPSRCPNASPILNGAPGVRSHAFTRLYHKPFTISEYNFSAPGRFRGVGGILTGAMGAIQGWGGIWRFAYSHSRQAMFEPARLGYFDMATDPLGQAAERASLCLFLRGDLRMAQHSIAVTFSTNDLARPPARIPRLAPAWHWAAWVTRLGTAVVPDLGATLPYGLSLPAAWADPATAYRDRGVQALNPYGLDDAQLKQILAGQNIIHEGSPVDPARSILRSETGELTLDGTRNVLILNTARTAGGFAPGGETIRTSGGVNIQILGSDATVWVSALDDQPIDKSRRLLVSHLTDLQNSQIRYAEEARQTLLDWGTLPYLVKAGQANLRIRNAFAKELRIWALSPGGKRLARVFGESTKDEVVFTADVGGDPKHNARMLYEIAPIGPHQETFNENLGTFLRPYRVDEGKF